MTKKIFQFLTFALLFVHFGVFAEECTLDEVPSPPVEAYRTNIRALIEATKKLATDKICLKPAGYPAYLDTVIPVSNMVDLMGRIQSTSYNFGSMVSDVRYYITNSSMVLPAVQNHHNDILSIQKEIIEAAEFVGSRCADNTKFSENITLEGSTYQTLDRTLEQTLTDMHSQTSHVLMYFRNRVTNVADEVYIDERYFSIAPAGFALQMREFYTPTDLQKCHDAEPKNAAIRETMKKAFSASWKYPEAIKIWKDAFSLLLYRSSQIAGNDTVDPTKEAEINAIVSAQKGGVGNSRVVINSQFFKEFKKRANNQTVKESTIDTARRAAYQGFLEHLSPYPFTTALIAQPRILVARLSLIPDFITSTLAVSTVSTTQKIVTDDVRDSSFLEVEKSLYDDYARLKENISQSKQQDPKTVTGLVQSLEALEKIRDTVEENTKIACDNLDKQGTNIGQAARCDDLIGGGH